MLGACESLAQRLRPGHLVVLESTTYPGTTREEVAPVLERSGLRAGRDFHLAFSPERVDPGRIDWTTATTPKVIGGLTPECTRRAMDLYGNACETLVPVTSPEVAELTKLLENIFRSVNIALVNELAMLCDRMGIDVWDVIDAAATKPFGFMPFRPGPGPRRPLHPDRPLLPHVEGAGVRPPHRVHRARREGQLADAPVLRRQGRRAPSTAGGKAMNGSRVLVIGVSYKADVNDTRESPALRIIELLRDGRRRGRVPRPARAPSWPEQGMRSRPLDAAALATATSRWW